MQIAEPQREQMGSHMSWIRLPAIVGAIICQSSLSAADGFWDGNKLFSECEKMTGLCAAYLAGLADTTLEETGIATPNAVICLPNNTNLRQLRDVVLKKLTDRPQDRTKPAVYISLSAIQEAWPCSK